MKLEHINVKEAVRYMGMGNNKPDERTALLIDECEKELLKVIEPKFVYRVFDVAHKENGVEVIGTPLFLGGNDICRHLEGCSKCVLFAATISSGVDRKLRAYEAEDMAKAMIADCLASAAVEQVCDIVDNTVKEKLSGYNQTWRFSPGYGDLPISVQRVFLDVLNAQKFIGLNATENNILTPRKSVTAVIGLSKNEISKGRRGCACCNMREVCQFRKRGDHCGV